MSTAHDELRELADAVPDDRVPAAAAFLRQLAATKPVRREFRCARSLSDEPSLAERTEEILRDELDQPDTSTCS